MHADSWNIIDELKVTGKRPLEVVSQAQHSEHFSKKVKNLSEGACMHACVYIIYIYICSYLYRYVYSAGEKVNVVVEVLEIKLVEVLKELKNNSEMTKRLIQKLLEALESIGRKHSFVEWRTTLDNMNDSECKRLLQQILAKTLEALAGYKAAKEKKLQALVDLNVFLKKALSDLQFLEQEECLAIAKDLVAINYEVQSLMAEANGQMEKAYLQQRRSHFVYMYIYIYIYGKPITNNEKNIKIKNNEHQWKSHAVERQ